MDVIVAGGEKVRLVGWVLVGVRGDRVGVNREEGIWAGSVHREGGLVVVGVCGALGGCVSWLRLSGGVSSWDGRIAGTAQRDSFVGVVYSFADATIASQSRSIGGSGVGGFAGYFDRHSSSFAHSSGWCFLKCSRACACLCSSVSPTSSLSFFRRFFFFLHLRRFFESFSRGGGFCAAASCSASALFIRFGRARFAFLAAALLRLSPRLRLFSAAVGRLTRGRGRLCSSMCSACCTALATAAPVAFAV